MHTTLVTTEELATRLGEWRIFDCRHDLMKPELGAEQYRQAHIPGALFAHMERDLSGPKDGTNGRHPLPDRGAFIAWAGQQGLLADDQVVCYDAANGSTAARLWWMLRWIGHRSVAVLDGGLAKWQREGRPVTAEVPRVAHNSYRVRTPAEEPLGVEQVLHLASDVVLVDARAPERYRGEKEPIDPVAGRIPGARNRFNAGNVHQDGTFKDAVTLRKEFLETIKDTPPSQVVNYCGSGVAACHNLLAMEIAGLKGARLYPGSWSEWIADPGRPRDKG
jgi:thiosulfate/3-mercaptopyruvate sulfurtransferase